MIAARCAMAGAPALLDGTKLCLPPQADWRVEYHWLEYAGLERDIWRWRDEGWHSTFNNARFTPQQLHDQGWRYAAAIRPPIAPASGAAAPPKARG
jgi:hypothetical protein